MHKLSTNDNPTSVSKSGVTCDLCWSRFILRRYTEFSGGDDDNSIDETDDELTTNCYSHLVSNSSYIIWSNFKISPPSFCSSLSAFLFLWLNLSNILHTLYINTNITTIIRKRRLKIFLILRSSAWASVTL